MDSLESFRNIPPPPSEPMVDFSALQWHATRPKEFEQIHLMYDPVAQSNTLMKGTRLVEYTSQILDMEGVAYVLVGIHEVKDHSTEKESLQWAIGKGDEAVELFVVIERRSGGSLETSANLERFDDKRKLPRGLGRMLYRSLFPYLQHLANSRNTKVIDVIDKYPSTGLTNEEWDRMFLPILIEQGYQPLSSHQFRREYEPNAPASL